MPLLVLTPIQIEFDHLSRYLRKQQSDTAAQIKVGRINAQHFAGLDLLLACGGLGKPQFALQTQHLIDHFPGIYGVVCAGSGGALAENVRPGDVVIATETVEHDCIYRFARRPPPRYSGSKEMLSSLHQAVDVSAPFPVHFGPVASGDEDVVDRKRAAEIRLGTGALAVAWEGAGGARASQFNEIPYLEIRGISDAANPIALISFFVHLGGVMERIGWLVTQLQEQRYAPDRKNK